MLQRFRLKRKKLLIIIFSWLVTGFLIACYDYSLLHTRLSAGANADFSFGNHVLLNVSAGLLGALMGGSFLVFYINEKYRDKPYGFTIGAVVISFVLVVSLIAVLLALLAAYLNTGNLLQSEASLREFRAFLFDPIHLKNIIAWSVVVALTQVMLQFNTKFGEGNLWSMIRGRYQTPREEQRIFMFVDLNNSTTIAEKLGDEKYHELLKNYFADLTNPILENRGDIYQYVGDEVVISWTLEDGLAASRCIGCFFDMKKEIEKHSEKYMSKYGLVPSFKAGIHCGRVVAGEVGIIKRDITFSGDVLNTTSRIQGKCKDFDTAIIVSDELMAQLNLSSGYQSRLLGTIQLRGKEKETGLYTIFPA